MRRTGKVKVLYDEIKAKLGTDFIPNLYEAVASNPDYLEGKDQAVTSESSSSTARPRRSSRSPSRR
jgi:hypothetical protein